MSYELKNCQFETDVTLKKEKEDEEKQDEGKRWRRRGGEEKEEGAGVSKLLVFNAQPTGTIISRRRRAGG